MAMKRTTGDSGEANVSAANVKRFGRGRHQNPPVRFWIITMLLVLFGLSTLKLR
jgi:UDP-N-acetylmuramyl pentapeptide phosphotransferase/UDP-N-acetylglucosamine-1-phosphate transferase